MDAKTQLSNQAADLIAEGKPLLRNTHDPYCDGQNYVRIRPFSKWQTGCRLLLNRLGRAGEPWAEVFAPMPGNTLVVAECMLGALESIKAAIDQDLLTRVEDLVAADAFGSLMEQAEYLLSKGWVFAAGVLGRAVLEEHLRNLCNLHGCLPAGRPTIGDLNQALYKDTHLGKIGMQQVTAMATVGNDCAHAKSPAPSAADVNKFLGDVRDFLVRHPLR